MNAFMSTLIHEIRLLVTFSYSKSHFTNICKHLLVTYRSEEGDHLFKVANAEIKFWSIAHNRVGVADFYDGHHAHVCALACGASAVST